MARENGSLFLFRGEGNFLDDEGEVVRFGVEALLGRDGRIVQGLEGAESC